MDNQNFNFLFNSILTKKTLNNEITKTNLEIKLYYKKLFLFKKIKNSMEIPKTILQKIFEENMKFESNFHFESVLENFKYFSYIKEIRIYLSQLSRFNLSKSERDLYEYFLNKYNKFSNPTDFFTI